MPIVEITLVLVAVCVIFAVVARELKLPYAVILVLGGMALAFIPGLPEVRLEPDVALAFFLPPLLQASAYRTDWRAFRSNLRPILLLAVGAVAFTALSVGWVAHALLPGLPWGAAIALGAIVAPPDSVAAAAVLQRLRLPRRMVTILEGESLVNDAAALVIYRLAVASVGAGAVVPLEALQTFLLLGAGGVATGYLAGRAVVWAIPRLDDTLLETAASFLCAYAAYLAAEAMHVSGVMAVVTSGALLGRAQHRVMTPQTRVEARAVWVFVEFLLNSLVFILIGLQLNSILGRLGGWSQFWPIMGLVAAVSGTLIVSRFVWMFPASWLPRQIPAIGRHDPMPGWRSLVVMSWAGMRGVVSLAVALSLPLDFPERDLIILLAFAAILTTLVLQGTTLEALVKRLRVETAAHAGGIDPHEAAARHLIAQASLAEIEKSLDDPLEGAIAADLVAEYRDRAGHLHRTADNKGAAAAERAARRRLRLAALEAGRQRLLHHHSTGGLHEESLAKLEQEIDLEELRVRQVLGDERSAGERRAAKRRRRG